MTEQTDVGGGGDAARLTSEQYWDGVHEAPPRMRLPSRLLAATRNIQRELRRSIRTGDRVLEIGCAPGKHLAWVAAVLGARAAGLDYSAPGMRFCRQLFETIGHTAELRCEDIFATGFQDGSFDVVYSAGVIEHFTDPRPIVRRHVELTAPGGRTLIMIPNYGGFYGRLQKRLDPDNLAIHNLSIMSPSALSELAPADLVDEVDSYATGRLNASLLNLHNVLPRAAARAAWLTLEAISALQLAEVSALRPILALSMRRAR